MSIEALDPVTMSRLAFIRLLYGQGVDAASLPEPLNVTSVLTLHDACELFLVLSGEHLGASLPRYVPFMDYWKLLPGKLADGESLPARVGMERLNDLRNSLKHRGSLPGRAAVDQAVHDVSAFIEMATQLVFGIPFGGIDLVNVVPQPAARDHLKAAAAAEASGDRLDAMAELSMAFGEVFYPRANLDPEGLLFSFGPTVSSGPWREVGSDDEDDLDDVVDSDSLAMAELADAVMELQTAMRVIAVGIDYGRFRRFERLTPRAWASAGSRFIQRELFSAASNEDFVMCLQFVITAALRMAEVEAQAFAQRYP